MLNSASNAKILTEEAKNLKEVSKENAFLMGKQLDFEERALAAKIEGKEAELRNYDLTNLSVAKKLEYEKLEREITALKGEQEATSVRLNRIEEARLRGLKRVSDALMKEKDLQKQILDARDKLAKRVTNFTSRSGDRTYCTRRVGYF